MSDEKNSQPIVDHCPVCDTRITIDSKDATCTLTRTCRKCGTQYEIIVSGDVFVRRLICRKAVPGMIIPGFT